MTKGADTDGNSTVGSLFNWTITISNTGVTNAAFGNLQTLLEDNLPAGPVYGALVAGSFSEVTNGANIDCYVTSNTLTCDAGGGGMTIGASGSFNVLFSVTPGDYGNLSNPAGICRVDLDGNVTDSDEGNNNCPEDTVSIIAKIKYLLLVMR